MKFTDGFWQVRPGVSMLYAKEAYEIEADATSLQVTAPTRGIAQRGDTLNRAAFSVTLDSPLESVIGVTIEHHRGARAKRHFDLPGRQHPQVQIAGDEHLVRLTSGSLTAAVSRGAPWSIEFTAGGRVLTGSGAKSVGYATIGPRAQLDAPPAPLAEHYLHEQLRLGVGERIYGLGERFGPLVKNGQTVEIWNADGGTSSEQAYKNVPFYLSSDGYGVLVDDPGHVSFEVGSEAVERVQFSVAGERLRYYLIAGPSPKEILERYTRLTGRPALPPAWSFGLWLSTSFTTSYDEATVTGFVDAMRERGLPLSVFHFDCFWMREFQWTDFTWDPRVFPDPEGMLRRLHQRGLRISVWINPYIAERSSLFEEAATNGYLLRRPTGEVWQTDLWQAGMGVVDFTNPEATAWYQQKLRGLLGQGVDALKTDFGERIPVEVVYADGSDPAQLHNLYAQLYNRAVFQVLEEVRGRGEAVVFARAATAGGQQMPVHWGGDSSSSFVSMAETLRGGLSLALSGFSFWSHDIGGFEGTPDPAVFKRWVAFGLLSSHSRLHGSDSYRVPWLFDRDPVSGKLDESDQSAVAVTRRFTRLKHRLMPYLYQAAVEASRTGVPVLRPMQFEFPDDPAAAYLDRQYLLGDHLLVAPVLRADGQVEFYLPAGRWTNFFTGEHVDGGRWRTEQHGFDTLPLFVREGAVLPLGVRDDRPDYDYLDGLTLQIYPGGDQARPVTVTAPDGRTTTLTVTRTGDQAAVSSEGEGSWICEVR